MVNHSRETTGTDTEGHPTINPLNLVFYSPDFFPIIGGITNVVSTLATELTHMGHPVTVITQTANKDVDVFPFPVLRRPGYHTARKAVRAADVFVQFNLSLKGPPIWIASGIPLVVVHNGDYPDNLVGKVKIKIANLWARLNLAVSHYTARVFPNAVVMPVPFRSDLFQVRKDFANRTKDLVFLGRLVSEKGVDLLLSALQYARLAGHYFDLTIIGDGPENKNLHQKAGALGLSSQVTFAGQLTGEALVDSLNDHKVMVVPSMAYEGFGLVALEGIACGCIVFAANRGGLPEAVGACGRLFPPENVVSLAEMLIQTRPSWEDLHEKTICNATVHLEKFAPRNVANFVVDSIRREVFNRTQPGK
ncbi:MAG: glycosyltransferase family 4 protein [Saprospiraceae bacterium]|nr:glycosyltransferase family 4 protein [Saprospiraceae bacterium]